MSRETDPLLWGRPPSPTLSTSLPLSHPYLPASSPSPSYGTSAQSRTAPTSMGSPNPYTRALSSLSSPPSPSVQRRPLDRIHHLPPPHLNHASSLPPPHPSPAVTMSSPHVRRLSTLLSLSPAPPAVPAETKRVEVVSDRTGRPQVREEREWPKPKKDAQYDDDALFDYHSLLIVALLLVSSVVLYTFFPEALLLGNAAYVWTTFLLSLFLVYHAALLAEMTLLKLLSLASGSRVWKVYFYSQALHETLGNVLTILYAMWCRYYCHYIVFPASVKQYLDPTLHFALLMFLAVIVRQVVTKHLTYVVNQERYAKAVQDLLFKGHVLARLCDQYAYQPLYTRPPPVAPPDGGKYEVPFPYTPLLSRGRKAPVFLSAASSSAQRSHPLYDIFQRLRDFNESLNDDYLPGGTGASFFSSEKVAKAKSKELFRNVDRDRKGYLDIHDFRAFFPRETALRAFKLFFPPRMFKVSLGKKGVEKEKGQCTPQRPPPHIVPRFVMDRHSLTVCTLCVVPSSGAAATALQDRRRRRGRRCRGGRGGSGRHGGEEEKEGGQGQGERLRPGQGEGPRQGEGRRAHAGGAGAREGQRGHGRGGEAAERAVLTAGRQALPHHPLYAGGGEQGSGRRAARTRARDGRAPSHGRLLVGVLGLSAAVAVGSRVG